MLRLNPNITTQRGANVLDHGQAHSNAAAILLMLGSVTLCKVTEEAVEDVSTDAWARVHDLRHQVAALKVQFNGHGALHGELNRIGNQVEQDRLETRPV